MSYIKCFKECHEESDKIVTLNIIDYIFRRCKESKINYMCHYVCIKALNLQNHKREGRWGFRPFYGVNEVFSVGFSILSLASNIVSYNKFIRPYVRGTIFTNRFVFQYYMNNLAFFSSTCFHIHENLFTRCADYFSAVAVLLLGMYVGCYHVIEITFKNAQYAQRMKKWLKISCFVYYIFHTMKMGFVEFDYLFNKISCIIIILITFISHLCIFIKYRNMMHVKNIMFFTGLFFIAGMIEVLDIPPYAYLIDSHALWHLIGSMSTPFYMKFWSYSIRLQKKKRGKN